MRNGDANNNPFIIFILGILFTLFGVLSVWVTIVKGIYIMVIGIGGILGVCGVIFIVFGIIRSFQLGAYKRLLKNDDAYITTAEFISSKVTGYTSTSVGRRNVITSANIYKTIYYSYFDENGYYHKVKSAVSYVPKQADYLQEKRRFTIKCKGKVSAIIEPLPDQNELFNLK